MRETIQTKILDELTASKKQSFSVDELAQRLSLAKSQDFKLLVQALAQLERDKKISFNRKGKIRLANQPVLIEGVFRANDRGFGFVTIDAQEEDIYIAKEDTNYAMDGDTVLIDILRPADYFLEKTAEGRVVEIKKRAIKQVVGEFIAFSDEEVAASDLYGKVVVKDKKLSQYTVLIASQGIQPVDGQIVLVELTHYPEKGYAYSLEGLVVKTLGHKNDPGVDILSIVIANGIPTAFPDEVLQQAEKVPSEINPADFPNRRDLRNELIVTIDGEDAKDLDDAVMVKRLANGNFKLGVHIADVSYYVTEDSFLDQEAFERGTSVYLTDRVIPMLPHRLSNGICSLNPKVPRLTMSCEMEIDRQGQVVDYEIFEGIIQTTERMTYTAVNQILMENDAQTKQRYAALVPMFEDMAELHEILERMRIKRGAVSFEDHEARVIVDEKGHPVDVILRTRGIGERLIESFMLAANETVATHFSRLQLPFIYRIHEDPKEEKLDRFYDFVAALGILPKVTNGSMLPKDLQQLMDEVADLPEALVINMMLLRSMQQAKYSPENTGHYGLAAPFYTHFTSPIRRYPDLIVHRLIRSYLKDASTSNQEQWAEKLPEIAQHSSQMERRAVEAERQVDAMKKAEYMQQHLEEEFEGVISSVVKFGFFVELPNTVEGLIHIQALEDDYYHFIESHLALVGEWTGRVLKIGQRVRVRVVQANPETREIDFALVSAEEVEGLTNVKVKKPSKNRQPKRNAKPEKKAESKKQSKGKSDKKSTKKKGRKQPFYREVVKKKKKKKK
ncbi:ribonuclease R [Enterococcus columbae]|uniref:Ribonuclease R n=1 Tax=Enterococcus columbae DSM 7374 = ATCC 51263 TaxID=1121865 RepID=S1N5J4_9ENTE|nr:ribonuclease R [Enterococcus columbae]EOT44959.1 ribonuclease R [Enterococcus columbae DSM 7374 = ATCC 51263]EOW84252.1 ribonuclease R [Enterococcus columbae DSM 7374 = ATCC 51263]OJG25002.1 ribonuclease R [Enterococcus columbae DSM 7374 = ATCC 51263]